LSLAHYIFIDRQQLCGKSLERKSSDKIFADCLNAKIFAAGHHVQKRFRKFTYILRLYYNSIVTINEKFRTSTPRADGRFAARHGLRVDDALAFVPAWQDECIALLKLFPALFTR